MSSSATQDKEEEHPTDKALDNLLARLEPKGSLGELPKPKERGREMKFQPTKANSTKAERQALAARDLELHAARKAKRDLAADPTMSRRKQKAIRREEAAEFARRKAIKREAEKAKADAENLGEEAAEAAAAAE